MQIQTISVVTICFNNLEDLQRTCASVDAQTYLPIEHWIINGSTKTDIADWLINTPQPFYRRFLNERDKGIADAFNKGIHRSTGSIIHLLNAGDVYTNENVLGKVAKVFELHPFVQWISGKLRIKRAGHWVEVGTAFRKGKLYRGMRGVFHPTWFVKKEVYNRIGLYDNQYKIAMDYDMLCRIFEERYAFVEKTLVVFDDNGISTNNYLETLKHNIEVYESHFGFSLFCRLWQLRLRTLHYLLGTKLGKWLFRLKNNVD